MAGRGRFKDLDQWPEPDQTRWRRALSPASLLAGTGHACKWRADTFCKVGRAWATKLHWLDVTEQLKADELPGQRVKPERLDAYCAHLAETCAPTTIRSHLTDLARALSVLAPGFDVSFIRRRSYVYPRTGDRLAKRVRMPECAALLQLGLNLMAEAEHKPVPTRRDAVRYRDGLLTAVLACRAMRLRNLTSVEIGHHLQECGVHWSLRFAPAETKNHRTWANGWPERLVPHLLRYLRCYRPLLMDSRYDGDHLWVSERPGPLSKHGVYMAIATRTHVAFGRSVNPHLFRDAAATSLAVHDPANVQLARHVLGHGPYCTTERYYNQAHCIEASLSLNEAIETRRKKRRALRRGSI